MALFKLLESLSESAWQQDLETDEVWVSVAFWKALGYDPKLLPISREAALALIHPVDAQLAADEFELLRRAEEPIEFEIRVRAATGEWRFTRMRGCVTAWYDGQPSCIGGILTDITEQVVAAREQSHARKLISSLSSRERQVLGCLVAGAANKNIAYGLGLSQRTVEGYRARLMDKLGVRSVSELIRVALAGGVEQQGATH